MTFGAGDRILLKSGDTFTTAMTLKGSGTSTSYVTVGSYGSGPMPVIDGKAAPGFVGIVLYNESNVEVGHIAVENAVTGILINDPTNQKGYRFIHLKLAGDTDGIQSPSGSDKGVASNILIQDVEAANNRMGCKNNACEGFALALGSVANVVVNRLYSYRNCGSTSWWLGSGASNVLIENSKSIADGDCGSLGGVTADFLDSDTDITFVNDIVADAPFIHGGVDFSAIDLEPSNGPDRGINIEDNYIAHNAGPGIELLDHPAAISRVNISGNVLMANGAHWSPITYPVWGQIWTDEWLPGFVESTGSITDNLYYAPTETGGFEQLHPGAGANYGGITQSDNIDVGGPDNVWYAAEGFSCSSQGANRWSYQSSTDNSTWTNLAACTPVDTLDQEWSNGLSASGMVSNFEEMPPSNSNSWVSRSWTAPTSGLVDIRGRVLMSTPTCHSGVTAEITKNGSSRPIWGPHVIHAGDDVGVATNRNGVRVQAGDHLHFAVQEDGPSQCRVSWTPSVAR